MSLDKEQILINSLKELEYFQVLEQISECTYSELGRELILKHFPTDDKTWLRQEHLLISEMSNLVLLAEDLPFEGINDIRTKIHKSLIPGAVLSSSEILTIKDTLRVFRLIKSFFKQRIEKYLNLENLTHNLFENRLLEKHIEDAIDDTGNVRDTASRELQRIRIELNEKSARLRNRLQKILKKTMDDELVSENFYSIREERFVIPIKVEHKRHIPGIIHGVSQTGSTVFLEPSEIIDMNNDLSLLKNEEQREIYKILSQLTGEIGEIGREVLSSVEIIAHIDSLNAKAKYAYKFGGCAPEIIEEKEIHLHKIFHPLLVHKFGKKAVIPLSITFSDKIQGHLISGPNAGGKTVALKCIGISVALALSGIFPLGDCKTGVRSIFTSIGDHQSIENNLSTFSSQITQLRDILEYSDEDSLVLIDEICSGTDPHEGSALASGIMDKFIENRLFFVVTTHQSALKTYALTKTQIENASLEFDEIGLKPTYKFLSGVPGNSYAFYLAKNLGLQSSVIDNSQKYIGERHNEIEQSIELLNKYRSEATNLRLEAENEKLKYQKLKEDFDKKLTDFKIKRNDLINDARKEASRPLEGANKLIENTIRQVKEDKKAVSEIKKEYQEEKITIQKDIVEDKKNLFEEPQVLDNGELKINDKVVMKDEIVDSSNVGIINEIDTSNKTALVEFGGIKFKIKLAKLNKFIGKDKKKKSDFASYIKLDSTSKIDLRGRRAEESIKEIDEFLSNAVLGNISQLTIIHGKGTGALRVAIQNFLKEHHLVKSYRTGDLVEGGAGVTVVEM